MHADLGCRGLAWDGPSSHISLEDALVMKATEHNYFHFCAMWKYNPHKHDSKTYPDKSNL